MVEQTESPGTIVRPRPSGQMEASVRLLEGIVEDRDRDNLSYLLL